MGNRIARSALLIVITMIVSALKKEDVTFLQKIYSQLDESDGLEGIIALRCYCFL